MHPGTASEPTGVIVAHAIGGLLLSFWL